jgi:hypothetical protein
VAGSTAAWIGAGRLWGEVLVGGAVLPIASEVCAAGSLALARRAERRQLSSPSGDRATHLNEGEKRAARAPASM